MSNILNDEELKRPEWLEAFELTGVLLLSLVCGLLVVGRGPMVQSISLLFVPLGIIVLAQWLFSAYAMWLKEIYLILGVIMAALPATLIEYIIESRKRAFIHDAFSHYLAPGVVEELYRHPEMLCLGGEKRHMTAFFSDIAGFSSFSEHLSPDKLVHFLNLYLSAMSDIILRHGGTIDKYEGDAIIAFFGAPLRMEDNATRCVLAALEQQKVLAALREQWAKDGYPEIHVRMGINTGDMVVGNMGTQERMNYTMMGDHVNLASRLEGVCKLYRTPILVSKHTYELVRETVAARFVDRVCVVGRVTPIEIYAPLGLRDEIDKKDIRFARAYEKAWIAMRNRQFDAAGGQFAALLKQRRDDIPSSLMLARCKRYMKKPPVEEWNGAFILTSK